MFVEPETQVKDLLEGKDVRGTSAGKINISEHSKAEEKPVTGLSWSSDPEFRKAVERLSTEWQKMSYLPSKQRLECDGSLLDVTLGDLRVILDTISFKKDDGMLG